MKKIITTIILLSTLVSLNNCMPAYVQVEPTYVEIPRPVQPSNTHVWIGANWSWSNRQQGYVQQNGYWSSPRRGRIYQEGHWNRGSRGSRWERGHWR